MFIFENLSDETIIYLKSWKSDYIRDENGLKHILVTDVTAVEPSSAFRVEAHPKKEEHLKPKLQKLAKN
jgi:hypothetical protein